MNSLRHRILATIAAALATTLPAAAQEKIRIGLMADFSGPFAAMGTMVRQGLDTYIADKGNKVGGREVEVIYRDITAATAKQIAEELVVREKVSIIGGFSLTPEAAAVASVATQAKIPTVLMVPASPNLMKMSPMFVRASNNIVSTAMPGAEWAYKQGKRRAYIAVSDYVPGHEVQAGFKKRFEDLGGKVVGEDRMPLNTVDYAPFAERVARSDADVVQIFVPAGAPAVSFARGLAAQGVMKKGIPVIGIAEWDEYFLPQYDDFIIGHYSSFGYSEQIATPQNEEFRRKLAARYEGKAVSDPFVVHGWDAGQMMYRMIESQAGKPFDGAAAVEAIKGAEFTSPRGPISIDAATRDIVQNMYIRQVQKVNGKLANVIIDTFKAVKPEPVP